MRTVVVAGGGPSGSIAAKNLAPSNINVYLVEKDVKRIKPCGGGIPSRAFEEFNLPVSATYREVKTISVISPKGLRVDMPLEGGPLLMVEREIFDRNLRDIAEKAGARLIEAEITSVEKRGRSLDITIIEDGKEKNLKADFLIAADGVNSRVVSALSLAHLPCLYTMMEQIEVSSLPIGTASNICCEFWFGSSHAPGSYSWVFPKNDHISIGTGSTDGKALKGLIENFKRRIELNKTGTKKVYRIPLKRREPLVYGNVLFVGDAAGLVMPLSYEGIYYAMKSGQMAAEAIIAGRPLLYEKAWKRKYAKRFYLMQRLKEHFLKNDENAEHFVELHRKKDIQKASMRLWLEKDLGTPGLLSYISFFRRFLH